MTRWEAHIGLDYFTILRADGSHVIAETPALRAAISKAEVPHV